MRDHKARNRFFSTMIEGDYEAINGLKTRKMSKSYGIDVLKFQKILGITKIV